VAAPWQKYAQQNGLPPGAVPIGGVDPRIAPQAQKAQNEATASQYAPATAQADATIKTAQAANAGTVADAEARKAEADAVAAQAQARMASMGGAKLSPEIRDKNIQGYRYGEQLQAIVDDLRTKFAAGPGATSGLRGIEDFFPSAANKNFDATANQSRGIVGQALGFTGGQLNTPQEAERSVGPFIPESSNYDSTIEQKIGALQNMADSAKQKAIQVLGGVPDANGNIQPVAPPQPSQPIGTQQSAVALGDGRTKPVVDKALQATGARLGAMVAQGVPDDQIISFLQRSGVDPANTNIGTVLQERKSPKFREWQRQNPGKSYPIGPEFYTKQVPVSGARALVNAAAMSPAGAFLASAANSATGNYLDNLTDNPEMARNGFELLQSQNPTASFLGDLTGYAGDEYLLGKVPGVGKLLSTGKGRIAADLGYGAFSGSGANDQDRGLGAVTGAAINAGGGMFGRGVQKALGATLTGIRNPALSYLDKAGIPLTIGRISRGAGDISPSAPSTAGDELGKGVAGIEDRLMGLPGLDAVIGTARQRGDQAFNQAAFREIAPGVTGTGAEGLTSAKAAEQAAYAKIAPVRLSVDKPFEDSLGVAESAAKGLNHHAGDVATVISDIRQQIADGGMTGKGYQTAMQAIRKTRATLNDDVGGKAAGVLDGLEQSVMDLGNRQGGQVAQDLAAANAIHGRRKVMQAALRGGPAQGTGEMVSPKALNQASIRNTTRFGGLDKALSPDRPFYDLTSTAMKVMPNLTPDSGTAGRLLLYPLIAGAGGAGIGGVAGALGGGDDRMSGAQTGAGIGTGLALLTAGAGAGPYSRTGQKIIQRALLGERPEAVTALGDFLRRNPRLAGMFGSTASRDFFQQPELPQ
jgi:hypothetical protein